MSFRQIMWLVLLVTANSASCLAGESSKSVTLEEVRGSIDRGCLYLVRRQQSNGAFPADGLLTHPIGVTSLATMAMLDCGMKAESVPVQRALRFLNGIEKHEPQRTHDLALLVMVLIASRQEEYVPRVEDLLTRLLARQLPSGGWVSSPTDDRAEPNLSQLAILALRDAADSGIAVPTEVWGQAAKYWQSTQRPNGCWCDVYQDPAGRIESVGAFGRTLTAVSALAICRRMQSIQRATSNSGLDCCQSGARDEALEHGTKWLRDHAADNSDPGRSITSYLHGLERAGRLGNSLIREDLTWYQRGALTLLRQQEAGVGNWNANNDIIATSHALLFLARGLAPVVINRIVVSTAAPSRPQQSQGESLRRHLDDIGGLAACISGRDNWPAMVTAQEVELSAADQEAAVATLKQAPVLFLTGVSVPKFSAAEKAAMAAYLVQGGVLLASPECGNQSFEVEFRELIKEIVPTAVGGLTKLDPDHPIYRAEFLIEAQNRDLQGIDTGCRTSVIYCPRDLSCGWSLATSRGPRTKDTQRLAKSNAAIQIGINVVAYASGREPPNRLALVSKDIDSIVARGRDVIRIGCLVRDKRVKIAPLALPNLRKSLMENAGIEVSFEETTLVDNDPSSNEFPIITLHGHGALALTESELKKLKLYLKNGGVLFADACCGSAEFDASFRQIAKRLFPGLSLKRIPLTHELFSAAHEIKSVQMRSLGDTGALAEVEPDLEGIEQDGRYVIVYSKYDISCALERPLSSGCLGYVPADAFRIATNVVLSSLLQQVRVRSESTGKN